MTGSGMRRQNATCSTQLAGRLKVVQRTARAAVDASIEDRHQHPEWYEVGGINEGHVAAPHHLVETTLKLILLPVRIS